MKFKCVSGMAAFAISVFAMSGCSLLLETPTVKGPGTVVYSKADLPEGTKIDTKDFEERFVQAERLPADAVRSLSELEGRELKYGLMAGQLVSIQDLK